jgi:hypothetical protein
VLPGQFLLKDLVLIAIVAVDAGRLARHRPEQGEPGRLASTARQPRDRAYPHVPPGPPELATRCLPGTPAPCLGPARRAGHTCYSCQRSVLDWPPDAGQATLTLVPWATRQPARGILPEQDGWMADMRLTQAAAR